MRAARVLGADFGYIGTVFVATHEANAALGYKAADADQAIRRAALALGPKATTEALIKKALG